MTDILNQFEEPRQQSPGEKNEIYVSELLSLADILGLKLSQKGQDALAVLVGEVSVWWRTADQSHELKVLGGLVSMYIRNKVGQPNKE